MDDLGVLPSSGDLLQDTCQWFGQPERPAFGNNLQKGKLKLLPHQEEQEDSTKFIVLTFLSIACIVVVLLASSLAYCLRHNSHYKLKEKLSRLGGDPSADATEAYQCETEKQSNCPVLLESCFGPEVVLHSGPSDPLFPSPLPSWFQFRLQLRNADELLQEKAVVELWGMLVSNFWQLLNMQFNFKSSPAGPGLLQELCRQRMSVRPQDRPEGPHTSRINSVSSQFSDGPMPSPSARSSTSSWSEEPVQSNMDISTGHMILAYMEDHLKNKNRLEKEWEALCAYQAEPNSSLVAQKEENASKNRSLAVLTYDHSRILLKSQNSHSNSDYINASPIQSVIYENKSSSCEKVTDSSETLPSPMVWESGCAVIVMLTPLSENGVRQCHHYWPDEGSNLYHVYEVNLVSEHIWCQDFLVRSFYLKNLQTNETRTVTQFHFLSWYDQGVPSSTRSLLDFRSDGAGRSGTYVLIDMVLNKMAKGAKEIDIAATLEHLRDQRPGMVQTKEQFEFALTAVAEEVNAILKALPQ
ncbi:Receptor-type tyrosine-protein phosphatase N2 [Microtus ochrogaster]|uniref:Receptor-type tyrosine-protein phosphatase N2 n=1 Tax=Microtus ochrogaster TaxID=79684 RepID=A0A8J6G7A6_MICOH|nr:Receptor-type tyrosine-protein phosphatase N2 [Microtus ochrogaster]